MKRHKSTKINILFPYMGNSIGGSHISSLILVKNLPQPYNPIVLLHKRGQLANYLEENKIPYFIDEKLISLSNGRWQYVYGFSQFTRLLKRLKIDIVHTNEINMHTTWLFPTFFSSVKHLWHQRTPGPTKSIFTSVLSSKVITISNYNKNSFPAFFRRKMEFVFNPFNFSSSENSLSGKKIDSTIHLAWVGNFHQRKRIDVFLKIIAELEKKPRMSPIVAHVYGTPLEPVLGKAKELINYEKITSKIHFHGFVNDISSELLKADILIASAEGEAFGRTLVEAAAIGIPIVANGEGGHKEIIVNGSTGILIPLNNIEKYVDSILELIKNNERRLLLIKNGYKHCRNIFSIEAHIIKITKIYNTLIN
tara:strand:- start:4 stop:1098 length:1095 start_codon:yes stop_codon:yes gene_type:complete